MDVLFYILGAIVLTYWILSMSQPPYNRPMIIMEKGTVVLTVGIGLFVVGFIA